VQVGRLSVDGAYTEDKPVIGKRVQFAEKTWAVIDLLRQERRRSFQQLADEAFRDVLAKYGRSADLSTQLRESVALDQHIERLERKVAGLKPEASGNPSPSTGMAMLRRGRAKNELAKADKRRAQGRGR
jgi:hypothetical protein